MELGNGLGALVAIDMALLRSLIRRVDEKTQMGCPERARPFVVPLSEEKFEQ